jgi:hypothetical protein
MGHVKKGWLSSSYSHVSHFILWLFWVQFTNDSAYTRFPQWHHREDRNIKINLSDRMLKWSQSRASSWYNTPPNTIGPPCSLDNKVTVKHGSAWASIPSQTVFASTMRSETLSREQFLDELLQELGKTMKVDTDVLLYIKNTKSMLACWDPW